MSIMKWLCGFSQRATKELPNPRGNLRFRPRLEPLEDRRLLAVFSVTNADDAGAGSLRWAIGQANATAGNDTIEFNITKAGLEKPQTILLESALPNITEEVLIDGFSQGDIEEPRIELNGAGLWGNGLHIQAGNVRVRGLSIVKFSDNGILIENPPNSAGCQVYACYIGVGLDGVTKKANDLNGIRITGPNNHIGDDSGTFLPTVISGNEAHGIALTGANAQLNRVTGCFVGVDATGLVAVGNGRSGVRIHGGASQNNIGHSFAMGSSYNVISGNTDHGVMVEESNNNHIIDNSIGLGVDGLTSLGNGLNGVLFSIQGVNNLTVSVFGERQAFERMCRCRRGKTAINQEKASTE